MLNVPQLLQQVILVRLLHQRDQLPLLEAGHHRVLVPVDVARDVDRHAVTS